MRVKELLELSVNNVNVYKGNFRFYSTNGDIPTPMREEDVVDLVVRRIETEVIRGEIHIKAITRDETPTEIYEREIAEKISIIRLSELATESIYGMFEAEPYEAAEFCRERDLSETEIDYLVSEEHRKYFEDEESEYY